MFDFTMDSNQDNSKLKEKFTKIAKQMKIPLSDDECEGLSSTFSLMNNFVENKGLSSNQENDEDYKMIRTMLGTLKGSREMEKILDKGIKVEYADGTADILKN